MRTWAPTTPNVRGVAGSLGCGATVRAACRQGLAAQLGRACGRGYTSSLGVQSACSARITYGSATFSDAAQSGEGNPVIGPCRCCIASGEVNVRRHFLFSPATVWLASRVLTLLWTHFGCGGDTSVATCYHSCGESVPVSWAYPARFNCWFPDAAILVVTSAAWDRMHSTNWSQRDDVCPKRVSEALRKRPCFLDQSCAQSAVNVTGNAAARTIFLPLGPAVSSEGLIRCLIL